MNNNNLESEHAWKYFEIHANQRISLFRYYVIFFSLYITTIGYLIIRFDKESSSEEIMVVIFSLLFAIITLIFRFIDTRNRDLIKISEKALMKIEKENKLAICKRIFNVEDKIANKYFFKHTRCFRFIFTLAIISALLLAFYSCWHIYSFSSKSNIIQFGMEAHHIKCEGIEDTIGTNIVVTISEKVIIQYIGDGRQGLIISKNCSVN